MHAAVMRSPGDIRIENVPKPGPRTGEVLLRVAAVGVCGSDIPRMLTKGAHRMPIICGHEFAGHVAEIGEGVPGFEIGELVGVAPLIPCGSAISVRQAISRVAATTTISAAGATGPSPSSSPCRREICSKRPKGLILAPWR